MCLIALFGIKLDSFIDDIRGIDDPSLGAVIGGR